MDLYSAFHPDCPSPTFVEPRSFADVRDLYVQLKSYPFLSGLTLYHCFLSKIEFCRTQDAPPRDFLVAAIRHPSTAKSIGYIMVVPPPPLVDSLTLREKSDPAPLVADSPLADSDSVFVFNHYSTILRVLGGSKFHVLFHAKLDASTCPLLYLIAAGQALAEHHPNSRVPAANNTHYWTGAVLFRLLCETERIVPHRRAKANRDLLALFDAPHLYELIDGVDLQYAVEVTNIRNMVQDARTRRIQALAADLSVASASAKTVEAVTNTAVLAKKAAGMAIQIARKERQLRFAAEQRERQTKQAAELRECELLAHISMLESRREAMDVHPLYVS